MLTTRSRSARSSTTEEKQQAKSATTGAGTHSQHQLHREDGFLVIFAEHHKEVAEGSASGW